MTFLTKAILTFAAAIFVFGILPFGAMYFLQGKLIFPAPDIIPPNSPVGSFSPVEIETPDGVRLRAWAHPAEGDEASILVFHGNADAAVYQVRGKGEALVAAGFGVLLVEYRGYGGSSGSPSEVGLIRDGLASYDYVRRQSASPIGLYAHSLGTAVAIPVAASRDVFAVALESPMTSILDVARYRMGWVPLDGLMKYPFRSDLLIGSVRAPLFILHGTDDKVIPFSLGDRLAAMAPPGTRFMAIDSAGHNNLASFGTTGLAIEFFKETLAAKRRAEK